MDRAEKVVTGVICAGYMAGTFFGGYEGLNFGEWVTHQAEITGTTLSTIIDITVTTVGAAVGFAGGTFGSLGVVWAAEEIYRKLAPEKQEPKRKTKRALAEYFRNE